MAAFTTVEDWKHVEAGYAIAVTIPKTEDEQYPSGWDYSLHLGRVGGETVLRYDNARERTKGHERHTQHDLERIEFPGMLELYDRFRGEVADLAPITWDGGSEIVDGRNTMPTLKVTVGESDSLDDRTRRRIEAAEAGDDIDDVQPMLNFASYADLSRLLSPKNLELLEAIAESEPDSIRAAARAVDRDYKQVHRNLSELEDVGVIEFEGGGSGRPKKPLLAYDGLEIDIPFVDSDDPVGPAAQ